MTTYSEGPAETVGDVSLHQRFYTQDAAAGRLVGKTLNVMFTLDRPAADVWPCFKDLNLWQNDYGHFYSGVIGDLEGETFRLSDTPDDGGPHQYRVDRVIPEHLMVMSQRGDWEGGVTPYDGYHVFTLNEHGGQTIGTAFMQHARLVTDEDQARAAMDGWRTMAEESHAKWRDSFVPTLKKLVDGR